MNLPIDLKPGLHVLAGKPMTGKTILALQLAIQAAESGREVFYWGDDRPGVTETHIARLSPTLSNITVLHSPVNIVAMVRDFLDYYGAGAFVVLDGLHWPETYEIAYDTARQFHELALRHGAALLAVRDTIKAPSLSSGNDGASDSSDSTLNLVRHGNAQTAHLHIRSRDAAGQTLALDFDAQAGAWRVLDTDEERVAA